MPILGTSPDAIDLAEDRDRFQKLIDKLGLKQPENGIAYSVEQARLVAERARLPAGHPPVLRARRPRHADRPRRGAAPTTCSAPARAGAGDVKARYPNDKTGQINTVLGKNPLLFDRYLSDAIEVDVDALADGKDVFVCGIMEHIEEAGIHSGDSACSLPPHSLSDATHRRARAPDARRWRWRSSVGGLMNVQYAIKDGDIYVLEVNPRASRTVPFVAKTIGVPIAKIGARVMAGEPLASFGLKPTGLGHVAVKEAVFPFARFPGVDTLLGPEMRSTGEVMGLDRDYAIAFAKSQLGAGGLVPTGRHRVRLGPRRRQAADRRRRQAAGAARLQDHRHQRHPALPRRPRASPAPRSTRCLKAGRISSMLSRTARSSSSSTPPKARRPSSDSRSLRRAALLHKVPYYTTIAGAVAVSLGIEAYRAGDA